MVVITDPGVPAVYQRVGHGVQPQLVEVDHPGPVSLIGHQANAMAAGTAC